MATDVHSAKGWDNHKRGWSISGRNNRIPKVRRLPRRSVAGVFAIRASAVNMLGLEAAYRMAFGGLDVRAYFKSRKFRLMLAWAMFWASLIGWPLSIIFTDEPPFILSLSWFAITSTAWDIICTTELKDE